MKKILIMFVGIALFACQDKKNQALISGKINKPQEKKAIYLMKVEGQQSSIIDSTFTDTEGNFSLNPTIKEADFYLLDIYGEQREQIVLTSKPLSITAEGKLNGIFQVADSEENTLLDNFQTLRDEYTEKLGKLQEEGMAAADEAAQQAVRTQYEALVGEYVVKLKSVIAKSENSFAAIAMLSDLDPEKDLATLDKIYTNLKVKYPENSKIKLLGDELTRIKKTAVGQTAPSIDYKDEKGNAVSLASFKGKYLLLDFWASWCKPCRMENPNVVKMYNQFKGKGFEILSISLDQDANAWKKAIQDDGLVWSHVTDLAYSQQTLATAYNVQAIPMTYLLDQNGVIIAKNLRGKELEDKLASLLQM